MKTTHMYGGMHCTRQSQLEMIERLDDSAYDGRPVHLADADNDEERKFISDLVGKSGKIYINWPSILCDRYFDLDKYKEADVHEEKLRSYIFNGKRSLIMLR